MNPAIFCARVPVYPGTQPMSNASFILLLCVLLSNMLTGCNKDFDKQQALSTVPNPASLKGTRPPNILILLGDDMGYEVLPSDGGQSYTTPNLDWLAQNGTRFTNCYASPMCCPSRLMLFTGKYNFRNYTEWNYMAPGNKTIANMLKDGGYTTCYAGKWQLDGGDTAIRDFGWERYSVWQPYQSRAIEEGSRYKSATIYQDGGFLPDSQTNGKYSEDEFTAYLLHFIDSVKTLDKPFFAFYSMMTCHSPYQPTPDDPEFPTWTDPARGELRFFASMMKYHDKKIGEIIAYLTNTGLLENTLILYTADNGTGNAVSSTFNDFIVRGGKGETNEPGTNVPLITYYNGSPNRGVVSHALVSFTDFLPTFKKMAGISTLSGYGELDGISFAPIITNGVDSSRAFLYNAYSQYPDRGIPFVRWVQTADYKLYDSIGPSANRFVKLQKCKPDSVYLSNTSLTPEEKSLKLQMQRVLKRYKL